MRNVVVKLVGEFIVVNQWFPTYFSSLPTFDVTDPQLPTTKLQYYRSLSHLYQSVRCKKKGLYVENIGEEQKIKRSARLQAVAHPRFGKGGHTQGSEGKTSSRQRIFAVSYKKNSHFSTLFIVKGLAMSAVTMDNAKIIISQLMSKSRSLAKISERRLQSLLV